MKTQAQIEATIKVYQDRLVDLQKKMDFERDFIKAGRFGDSIDVYAESCKAFVDYKTKMSQTKARIEILEWVLDK